MKKFIIAAAVVLSTGIVSANALMHKDTTATTTPKEENTPVATNTDQVSKMTKKDIGTAD
ncbi:hypothetical protein CKK33_10015 [Mucilaginibacter sp. MD40]|uniref:hypothetical protein n=1 Tax=Mucilaginibacter sp. MD40 TaxID=2029590 RepID=UPI000BAC7EC3|nr:hypothetical protein [Mucilaginibacter sp. MD40]PAW93812.1 hypothetical protein CKK33_10015 [Mucilaginibacter sp. MD40]